MNTLLKSLLDRLDAIGAEHEELFDSDVRQNMSNAIMEGFVRHRPDYIVPQGFGMFSDEANAAVRNTISEFVVLANDQARDLSLISFHDRLRFVQDPSVQSDAGNDYDEFLGHSPPEFFDDNGNVIRTV